MRLFPLVFLWSFLSAGFLFSQDEPDAALDPASLRLPGVAELSAPPWYPELVSYNPAVTARSAEVQQHVNHGMALIHGGWDFEAYRHFLAAVEQDPDCLMAYWGMALSLANPNTEAKEQRAAALNRLFALIAAGKGTEGERAQGEALLVFFSDEPQRAPGVFRAVSEDYPNHLQLQLMAAFLQRDGYDELLGPGPGQRAAVEEIEAILAEQPDSRMALSFWANLQIENPAPPAEFAEKLLPRVRTLTDSAPEFPPYRELLGTFERRAGQLSAAKANFQIAIELYEKSLAASGVSIFDCPNLIRAKLSLAHVLHALGEDAAAKALAQDLAAVDVPYERLYSPGATLLLWEGRTLGARLALAGGEAADFAKGLASLPAQAVGQQLAKETPSVLAWEAWHHALSCRQAIGEKDWGKAERLLNALATSDGLLGEVAGVVATGSSRQSWQRTRRALKVEWMLTKGLLATAQAGAGDPAAGDFWFRSAVDELEPPQGLFPPLSQSRPALIFARHLAQRGDEEGANQFFAKARLASPHHVAVLRAQEKWLRASGKTGEADRIKALLATVIGK
ncbi:hypothetical protein [Roseibacillus ishigakijimensis]|uniref:Tetratricopeptide repeat protein n=1 Tax=Roseibacillus ishigakijimensis TaxID=454146 RepID=A0A934RSL4_9BACT|nr:hypothetical protein [Roseibacillus ishigakijimensis]MBK1833751.1 hypothetical protein [Roseibacillus ishigakijimensis]